MRRKQFAKWFLTGLFVFVAAAGISIRASSGVTFSLVAGTSSLYNAPIGIDWLPQGPFRNELLLSWNYPTGDPLNFLHLNRFSAASSPWGSQGGWNNEIYFVTARPGQDAGGWVVGEMFSAKGNATPGDASTIARFHSDGTPVDLNFATLPGETKQKRGGITFDRFGIPGAAHYNLVVIAADDRTGTADGPSDVYTITSSGLVTHLAQIPVHVEGVTTIPNDVSMYGPWAGQILAAAEFDNQFWTIDPTSGATQAFAGGTMGLPYVDFTQPNAPPTGPGEDLWVIPPNHTFYGVEYGDIYANTRLWKVDAAQWTSLVGQVLVAAEYNAQLYAIRWDAAAGTFVTTVAYAGSTDPATGPTHWEHITFAPDPAALGDFVWNDSNADSKQDAGEPGIPNVSVTVTSCDSSFTATMVTDASGHYAFTDLTPDCYFVTFGTPGGYTPSPANQGPDDSIDSDSVGGVTGNYTLGPGETNNTVDAGFYKPAAIGDFVWSDNNSNGIQDAGEPGVPNVTVQLYSAGGVSLLATTTTAADGSYLFSGLMPGTYTVKFTLPSGSVFTAKDQGANDAKDSDANTTAGFTGDYTLASGQTDLTVDAGITPVGKVFTIAGSMEGNLSNIRPGDWVNGGYSFKFVSAHTATTFVISGNVSIPVKCSQGGGAGGTIVVPLNQLPFGTAVPSIAPVTGTPGPNSIAWGVPANNTNWLASGDQNNVWTWSGAVQAPDLCGGKPMDDVGQAVFTVTVFQAPPSGSLVDFRFHYRDPAAKDKPNTNCLNTSDPNRAKADVCGASWSATKRDP